MKDYFLRMIRSKIGPNLKVWRIRFKGVGTKKRNILIAIALVLCMRLFFYAFFDHFARAEQPVRSQEINPEIIDPMTKLRDEDDIKQEKVCADVAEDKKSAITEKILAETDKKKKTDEPKDGPRDGKIREILAGYPMEKMIKALGEKDKETAAFLVAIAKKESDWGKHAPSKSGRDCYNYWGYKGNYKLAQGYSCFDSPEQAVEVVGKRIDELTKKGLHTPERMVVWKCGSSCSWDRPEAVKSWIGAVRTYWQKLI